MRQQEMVFCVAIESCRASRRRTDRCPATRCLHRPAFSRGRCSAASAPVRMQLTKSSLCKSFLSFLPSTPRSNNRNQSFHTERGLRLSFCFFSLWEKVPGHAMGFSRGMRKRAAIDASTPAAYTPVSSFSLLWRWSLSPFALFMCAVGLVAGLLLGRLACKGDEDMSPRLGNGAGLRVLLAS